MRRAQRRVLPNGDSENGDNSSTASRSTTQRASTSLTKEDFKRFHNLQARSRIAWNGKAVTWILFAVMICIVINMVQNGTSVVALIPEMAKRLIPIVFVYVPFFVLYRMSEDVWVRGYDYVCFFVLNYMTAVVWIVPGTCEGDGCMDSQTHVHSILIFTLGSALISIVLLRTRWPVVLASSFLRLIFFAVEHDALLTELNAIQITIFFVYTVALPPLANYCLDGEMRARCIIEREVLDAQTNAQRMRKQAARQLRLHEQYVRYAFHELRVPFNSIVLGVDTMAEGTREIGALGLYTLCQQLQTSCGRVCKLMDNVLDLSALQTGRISLSPTSFDIRHALDRFMASTQPLANHLRLDIVHEVAQNVPTLILADWHRLSQVLDNLLHNAFKFTPGGGRVTVLVEATSADTIQFAVCDTGIGIAKECQPKIFVPYELVGQTNNSSKASAGLGLSICKHIVALHNGKIWLESDVGMGARFFFTIPTDERSMSKLQRSSATSTASVHSAGSGSQSQLSSECPGSPPSQRVDLARIGDSAHRHGELAYVRVLVVDNSPETRDLLSQYLFSVGAQVTSVPSGEAAVEFLREEPSAIDLVIVDRELSGMTGAQCVRELRAMSSSVLIVGFTGDLVDIDEFERAGLDCILTKPLNKNRLASELRRLRATRLPEITSPTMTHDNDSHVAVDVGAGTTSGVPPALSGAD